VEFDPHPDGFACSVHGVRETAHGPLASYCVATRIGPTPNLALNECLSVESLSKLFTETQ